MSASEAAEMILRVDGKIILFSIQYLFLNLLIQLFSDTIVFNHYLFEQISLSVHLGNVSRDTKKLLLLTALLIVFSRMGLAGLISTIRNSLDWNTFM